MYIPNIKNISLCLLLGFSGKSFAQTPESTISYPFFNESANLITNTEALRSFIDKMHERRNGVQNTINIVHIGDSHIQADWFGERIRDLLQAKYGNAGRGLIVPFKVAGTNEPNNFVTNGSGWTGQRLVTKGNLPIGVGALTLQTQNPNASLSISLKSHSLTENLFQKVQVFCDKKNGFDWQIKNGNGDIIETIANSDSTQHADYTTFILPKLDNSTFSIACKPNTEGGRQATIFGINVTNFESGICYHSIGINGAKYEHYNAAERFAQQLAYLKPDLIIIGLGSNEAQTAVETTTLIAQITQLTNRIKNETFAPILLYTPADSYLHGSTNPNFTNIAEAIKTVSEEQNMANWDLYNITTGKGSAVQWKTFGLMAKDGIHYAKKGYYIQAEWLFNALEKMLE